ncbi:Kdo domain containing protein [Flavobacterium psychrophilum]|uniref:lipopolysaccharide kinase InaA family protein n=1 Tax=Flavobacterium psychrophilum TaxID=96345 RepID=UPI0006187AAA|nr:lipopolysaccharide kinase InaA family protein [Flavobacterium psychrophilum]AKC19687.1 Kdo domain containing protein [Flavobacterium psychrophilum]AKC24427.1 Kdo domain containing protein [Flavobacterium psychrophilum]AKC29055.1 Kdo domain containing protein [Flavobacterium psychrophilum]
MNNELLNIITNFDSLGSDFVIGKRNKIKTIPYNDIILNVKSFKIPFFFNGIVYKFFRKSKAERSYNYAKILSEKGIGTPNPIGFYENKSAFRLLDSYYICEHLSPDYVFKDLFNTPNENLDDILRQFTYFTFNLHERGIEFLDHSSGNTLLKKVSQDKYEFYLVDLNRMKFHKEMDFKTRMKNFNRITPSEAMMKIISFEYAKLYGKPEEETFQLMWKYASEFQEKARRKIRLKKKLGIK